MDRPKFGILRLDNLRLIKCNTEDEMKNLFTDLENKKIPYEVFKDHGDVYSRMEQWR
jgi:hypothetical protein